MYYVASNGLKTAVISPDLDAENPRIPDYQDHLTHMICWHKRYHLGDSHEYEEPHDFAQDLANRYVDLKEVVRNIHQGHFEDLRLVDTGDSYRVEVKPAAYIRKTPDWRSTDWQFTKEYELIGDLDASAVKEDLLSEGYTHELVELCAKNKDLAILPLYLYDHSGISMSTASFVGRAVHAEWDSGTVGFIYMDREAALQNFAHVTEENWKDAAETYMQADVKEYDNYLTGEVYGYQLYDGFQEVDSCWGFNPGTEEIAAVMKAELSGWLEPEMEFKLEWEETFDIEDYFASHDFPALRQHLREAVEGVILFHQALPDAFPFAMPADELLANKNGILDDIVSSLYEEHMEPDSNQIYEVIGEQAGISREVQPKITVEDLEPGRDYTVEEVMEILKKKPSLNELITAAEEKRQHQLQQQQKSLQVDSAMRKGEASYGN